MVLDRYFDAYDETHVMYVVRGWGLSTRGSGSRRSRSSYLDVVELGPLFRDVRVL